MKALALVFVLGVTVQAQATYIAFEQITVAAASIGMTLATINVGNGHPQANSATCRLETAEIRWRMDGAAPTTTVGTLMYVGDVIVVSGNDTMNRFRAIRTGATSGVLSCTYVAP